MDSQFHHRGLPKCVPGAPSPYAADGACSRAGEWIRESRGVERVSPPSSSGSSVRFLCPVLLRCSDTHVWWELEGNLRVGWEPSPCPPSLALSHSPLPPEHTVGAQARNMGILPASPSLIPKLLQSVTPLPDAINLCNIANWNTFLQPQALVTVIAFSVSSHLFHKHLLSAGAQYVQEPC